MECTQRLQCTQEIQSLNQSERIFPEQVAFLGICGETYPVLKGPNKIGRDPQTCNIVLNLNSISRQHAVINILSEDQHMLMDLGSANKTKLVDKILQPYIPYPMKNGDTVQFGNIFGIFRLLEDGNDLPQTQAYDIPDTPVATKQISKLNHITTTTIPESPDVSDKEDSYVVSSQSRNDNYFKSPNNMFIKSSGKTIAIQPVGSNKIDNIYWKASKKSCSVDLGLNDFNNSVDEKEDEADEAINVGVGDTINTETQDLSKNLNNSNESIYTASTQLPPTMHTTNTQLPSTIHTANTQLPPDIFESTSIHTMDTQLPDLPIKYKHLPEICKINKQLEMQCDLNINKTQNPISIFNAETQIPLSKEHNASHNSIEILSNNNIEEKESSKKTVDTEYEIFDELDSQSFLDEFELQPHQPETSKGKSKISKEATCVSEIIKVDKHNTDLGNDDEDIYIIPTQTVPKIQTDNDLTDCEDNNHEFSKKIFDKRTDDDLTDCEDDLVEDLMKQDSTSKLLNREDIENENDLIDCEDDLVEDLMKPGVSGELSNRIGLGNKKYTTSPQCEDERGNEVVIGDLATQAMDDADTLKSKQCINREDIRIIKDKHLDVNINKRDDSLNINFEEVDFADLPTQVIGDYASSEIANKGNANFSNTKSIKNDQALSSTLDGDDVDFADMPTQVLADKDDFEDLPTQNIVEICKERKNTSLQVGEVSPFKIPIQSPIRIKRKEISKLTATRPDMPRNLESKSLNKLTEGDNYYQATQDIVNDLYTQREQFPNEKKESLTNNSDDEIVPCSVEDYELGDKFPNLNEVSPRKCFKINDNSLDTDFKEEVNQNVSKISAHEIKKDEDTFKPKQKPSDPSDLEDTPKKPLRIMEIELPNSQEIKRSISLNSKTLVIESSSDSETENNSEECTPILFRNKKKNKDKLKETKTNLTKRFTEEALPSRILTRQRKPTPKILNNQASKMVSKNILKPKFLTEQENDIDPEIITENISRLKKTSHNIAPSINSGCRRNNTKKYLQPVNIDGKMIETNDKKTENKSETNKKKEKTNKDKNGRCKYDKKDKTPENAPTDIISLSIDINANKSIGTKRNVRSCRKKINSNQDPSQEKEKLVTDKTTAVNLKENRSETNKIKEQTQKDKNEPSKLERKDSKNNRNTTPEYLTTEKNISSSVDKKSIELSVNKSIGTKRNVRSCRKKIDSNQDALSKKEEKPVTDKTTAMNNTKKLKTNNESDTSSEDVRCKKRQRPTIKVKVKIKDADDKKISKPEKLKSILKNSNSDASVVYSMSSGSGTDSPNLKRSASELEMPSPKRTRSGLSNSIFRSTPARAVPIPYVLFTAFPEPVISEVTSKLERLGAKIVQDVTKCTVLVTPQVKRTFKLLCAVGLGRPIVGPNWIQACHDTNIIVDPWLYLLKDEAAEKRFQFNLHRSLIGKRMFLKGYNISCTPQVKPTPAELQLIVECSGGKWKAGGPQWICVSCSADKGSWQGLKHKGATLVSAEFVLSGVLKQQVNVEGNLLERA